MYRKSFKSVIVKSPGSSANLGPGFDCLGMAWALCNTMRFSVTNEAGVFFSGCEKKYQNKENPAFKGFIEALKTVERKMPEDFGIEINFLKTEVPLARGLGSSACLAAAGAFAADKLFSLGLTKEDIFYSAANVEGHPDNAAPAVFGGLTAAGWDGKGRPVAGAFPVNKAFSFTALVPDFEVSTKLSRSVLPKAVSMKDAVSNISNTALLLKAFEKGDENLLRAALRDELHQKYRTKLIPEFDEIKKAAEGAGVPFICISGAGPSLLAISLREAAPALEKALEPFFKWRALPLKPGRGVREAAGG